MYVVVCDSNKKERMHTVEVVCLVAKQCRLSVKTAATSNKEDLMRMLFVDGIQPDVVLLDIDLPDENGITVGQEIRDAGYNGAIVFTSHDDDMALPAFDVGAFNYALKGGRKDDARLARIMLAAAKHVEKKRSKHIMLNGITQHENVPIDEIRYFSVERHIATCHWGEDDKTIQFISTLGAVEDRLTSFGFVRCHRSYIVNPVFVSEYYYTSLTLLDGTKLPIGRVYYQDVKQSLGSKEFGAVRDLHREDKDS